MSADDDHLIGTVSRELYERLGKDSIFSLPWVAQVVTIVAAVQGDTDNGGIICFFEADWPGSPPYSVFADAFRAIGADETAECIEAAATLFPFSAPHVRGDARRDYLRDRCMIGDRTDDSSPLVRLGERVIDSSDANYALLAQQVREHLNEIRNA